ncbi:ATPase [Nereida sp. MMG025]|uniref:ATPase n=1 Tax=Nereida sp. MMG025 TaxID=2909981 RepID=UPI001F48A3BE|nr:ATPase [Nereida sp. MMG025]MCF6443252.1 ATPase [Nereida sp. MMG025]
MIYKTADDWRAAPNKRVVLFAMSGLGKTHVSEMLQHTGEWFHYAIDYRIGTRYMAEHITDNLKREAMKVPALANLLRRDAIYLGLNIHDHDLTAVADYTGKPGKGALGFDEYMRRQKQFRAAECAALLDTSRFMDKAKDIYGYDHFICDTGGSICEWVDPSDPDDEILTALSKDALLVWIEGTEEHNGKLVDRFDRDPKPMCYNLSFTQKVWQEYLSENNVSEDEVDPDAFIRVAYRKSMDYRQPRYAEMAKWGVTVKAADMMRVQTPQDFIETIANSIG